MSNVWWYYLFFIATQQHSATAFHPCGTTSSASYLGRTQRYIYHKPPVSSFTIMAAAEQSSSTAAAACVPGGRCLPCESLDKSHLLSPEQIESELTNMKLWQLSDDKT